MAPAAPAPSSLRQLPRGVWALGLVSLFMDLSSEMIHALLPLYLVSVLGASMVEIGVIEGIAEATAMIVKIFSGALSDWLGRRKLLAAVGYGLAAVTKPVFPLAANLLWIVAARFVDRIGKGIRGAPRDALIADITPAALRGAAFGLRQALDTVGAFLGPLAAIALMWLSADRFKLVFWIAVVPAMLSFALIVFVVEEPARPAVAGKPAAKLRLADCLRLPALFWLVVAIASVLTLARFSEAFLVLKAQNIGVPIAFVPAVMVVMSAVYALSAYPAGAISDRIGRRDVLIAGTATLIAADLVLAFAGGIVVALLGVALWGLHMGLTQGLLSAMVADTAPAELRGTAFGLFNLAGGISVLLASIAAGALWDNYGPAATFTAGAVVTALGLAGLLAAPQPPRAGPA
jgi:MFS family permease